MKLKNRFLGKTLIGVFSLMMTLWNGSAFSAVSPVRPNELNIAYMRGESSLTSTPKTAKTIRSTQFWHSPGGRIVGGIGGASTYWGKHAILQPHLPLNIPFLICSAILGCITPNLYSMINPGYWTVLKRAQFLCSERLNTWVAPGFVGRLLTSFGDFYGTMTLSEELTGRHFIQQTKDKLYLDNVPIHEKSPQFGLLAMDPYKYAVNKSGVKNYYFSEDVPICQGGPNEELEWTYVYPEGLTVGFPDLEILRVNDNAQAVVD